VKIYTIEFTITTAQNFFERLKSSGAKKIIEVRLNNVSQLAGFAKRDNLKFFAKSLCGMGYQHAPKLAPAKDILDDYKKKQEMPWEEYEDRFLDLMAKRKVEDVNKENIEII